MKSLLTNSGTVPLELSELPCDHELPGLASLLHQERLTTTLSCVLAEWLEPYAQLLQTRVFFRRLFPGQRCRVELELVVEKRRSHPAEHRRLRGKFYKDDQGPTLLETLDALRR